MLSSTEFVRKSLELHLFFLRIMKEHLFFLEVGFTQKDLNLTYEAETLRMEFNKLLADTICLSNGVVNSDVLKSGEVITPFTLNAEIASAYLTGICIPIQLSQAEEELKSDGSKKISPMLEQEIVMINKRALSLVSAIVQYKTKILSGVLSCKIFTSSYPLLIDHILREAKFYYKMIQRLQKREDINIEKEAYEQEVFWNRIMAEHSKFIRGLLDPSEDNLINIANNFGNEFDRLTEEALAAMEKALPIEKVTNDSLKATIKIKEFKQQGTQGLLDCKIKSIIIPLLADHTLREANHYLRLLNKFKEESR